jgi:hypothetical protein
MREQEARIGNLIAGFVLTRNPCYVELAQDQLDYELYVRGCEVLGATSDEIEAFEEASKRLAGASLSPSYKVIEEHRALFRHWLCLGRPHGSPEALAEHERRERLRVMLGA